MRKDPFKDITVQIKLQGDDLLVLQGLVANAIEVFAVDEQDQGATRRNVLMYLASFARVKIELDQTARHMETLLKMTEGD